MPAANSRIRILHLEDDPRDAQLIEDLLVEEGFAPEIVRVADRKAFESVLVRERFDAILTDFNLPDYDGISALRFANQCAPAVPVIVISGAIGEEAAVQCLKHGATDYLLKDRLDRLGPALRRAVQEAAEQQNRRRTEERFAAIFNSAPIAIAFGTLDGLLVDVNPELCTFFGYTNEEMIGRTTAELFLWAEPDARTAAFERLRAEKTLRNHEAKFRRKSGEVRSALVSMEILRVEHESMLLTMIVDVTERKALEAQLHRAQRVESVGRLASGIAHDMNNILAPIMMAAPLLRMPLSAADEEKMLSTIESSAQRGAALVRQLLIFGRGVEGERRPVHLANIIEEVFTMARQTFPRNITITVHVPPETWPVSGDATQLHQVLLNLCVNSRDAMPNGGSLSLSAENVVIDAGSSVQFGDARPGRYVKLRVADTGGGIAPEIMDHIFDPFFTTKDVGQGTGLGLSTVAGIVRSHGGFVRLHSEVGSGTRFDIHLPASSAVMPATPRDETAAPLRGQGELILIVDDEEPIRAVVRDMLVRHNYRVITAGDGVEATAVFAANVKDTKVVLTDLDMPLIGGINLAHVLRRMNPAIKIVISTGLNERSGADQSRLDLKGLAVQAILTKPYTADTLLATLHEILHAQPADG